MADTKREIERKYEATRPTTPAAGADPGGRGRGRAPPRRRGTRRRLLRHRRPAARRRLTHPASPHRRRRRGLAPQIPRRLRHPRRDPGPALRHPPGAASPHSCAPGCASAELVPVVRLRSSRDVRHLLGADGVAPRRAQRRRGPGRAARGRQRHRRPGPRSRSNSPTTATPPSSTRSRRPAPQGRREPLRVGLQAGPGPRRDRPGSRTAPKKQRAAKQTAARPRTAGDHVLAYVRDQSDAIVDLDPAVRRDLPDSVHQMRVATRRTAQRLPVVPARSSTAPSPTRSATS